MDKEKLVEVESTLFSKGPGVRVAGFVLKSG